MKKFRYCFLLVLFILPCALVFAACGERREEQKVERKNLSVSMVQPIEEMISNGEELKPTVSVVDGTKVLVVNKDYTLLYGNNINSGFGNVYLTGIGDYTGTVIVTFKIIESLQILLDEAQEGETVILKQNFSGVIEVPENVFLEVQEGAKLTVSGNSKIQLGGKIINNGTILVEAEAELSAFEGTFENNGNLVLVGNFVSTSQTTEVVNNGKISFEGGLFDAYINFTNLGEFEISTTGTINVNNLALLTQALSAVNLSGKTGSCIRIVNTIDLEEQTISISSGNSLDLQSFSLTNGIIQNYGRITIVGFSMLQNALNSTMNLGTVEISEATEFLTLEEVITVPEGVTLKLCGEIVVSSSNCDQFYLNVLGSLVGTQSVRINVFNDGVIKGSTNFKENGFLLSTIKAGIYQWNQSFYCWELLPA